MALIVGGVLLKNNCYRYLDITVSTDLYLEVNEQLTEGKKAPCKTVLKAKPVFNFFFTRIGVLVRKFS